MNKVDLIIADKMLSNQISLLRFTAGESRKVLKILTTLQKELKAKLYNDLTDFSKARVKKLLKESTEIINSYYAKMQGTLDVQALANHEAKVTVSAFASIDLDATLPTVAVMKSLTGDLLLQGSPLSGWWQKQPTDLSFKYANAIRQSVAQSETLQQAVRRVFGSKRLGTPGIGFPAETLRRNASALVHTSIMQVANDARLATFKANDDIIKGMRFLATLDSHTSLTCIAHSGAEWDMEGNPIVGNFPFEPPPLHFNCRSMLVPVTLSYRELGIDVPEIKGTRASDLGQIPSDTTFDGFLKRHDTAYVDDLLGPGRAKLWRDGKITLNDLLGQTGRPLTLDQLRKKGLSPRKFAKLGKIIAGSRVKSANDILKHYEKSKTATFIKGRSASELKSNVAKRLGERMYNKNMKEWTNFVEFTLVDSSKVMTAKTSQKAVKEIISQWACTSGEGSIRSIAMQLAAKAEFGLEGSSLWWRPIYLKEATKLFKIHEKAMRSFLREMYKDTQEYLAKQELKTIRVVRGYSGDIGILSTKENPIVKIKGQLQPMSSFSADFTQTKNFIGEIGDPVAFFAEIPIDRVLSCPVTGYGCRKEVEYVVLGPQKAKVDMMFVSTTIRDMPGTDKMVFKNIIEEISDMGKP